MPHFFFHFLTESERQLDSLGLELPSIEAACLEAAAAAAGMAGELLASGIDPSQCSFDIEDASGSLLLSIDFAELLRRKRGEEARNSATVDLTATLEGTHRRASRARQELATSLLDTRASLIESQGLMARLSAVSRR